MLYFMNQLYIHMSIYVTDGIYMLHVYVYMYMLQNG
jgi:hypothetical protein